MITPLRSTLQLLLSYVVAIGASTVIFAQTTINTIPAWDGVTGASPWGGANSGGIPTYGETFQADATHSNLNAFTFEILNPNGPINFVGRVYEWNGTSVTTQIFSGAARTVIASATYQAVTVHTGLALVPGTMYAVVFTTIGSSNGLETASFGLIPNSHPVSNSMFIFNNSTTNAGLQPGGIAWNTTAGVGPFDLGTLAFQFDFSNAPAATPENGATALLLALGAGTLLVLRAKLLSTTS